jgi:hypothetical protein
VAVVDPDPVASTSTGTTAKRSAVSQDTPTKKRVRHEFTCQECNLTFDRKQKLMDHSMVHRGERYHCDEENCMREFNTMSGLTRHKKQQHYHSIKFTCDVITDGKVCGWSTLEKASLQAHKFYSHEDGGVPCPTCGKVFGNKKNMMRHTNYCTSLSSDLQDIGTPLPERPPSIVCTQCDPPKSFKRKESYKAHTTAYHAAEPKFLCKYCARPYSSRYNLMQHIAQVHPAAEEIGEGDVSLSSDDEDFEN